MATAYIEINDSGIIQAIDGGLIDTSPAFAVLDNDRLILGQEARENARLLPRWTNNRFWHQLSRDPISNATHNIRHHADLAFAHLESMWNGLSKRADKVIIGVRDIYDQSQLGLLLGMANEAKIPVAGLVNSALVSVARQANQSSILHLDISLHRITLTEFQLTNELKIVNAVTLSETGLFTLWDRWANVVAQQFIHASRFDPMHEAHSEQLLFDLLPKWITRNNRNTTFNMDISGVIRSIHIPEDQLIQVCQSIYPKIVQSVQSIDCSKLYISHRFQGFPGLEAALKTIPKLDIHRLTSTSSMEAVHHHHDDIISKDGGISHVTSLSLNAYTGLSTKKPIATHLLYKHQACAIGDSISAFRFGDEGIQAIIEGTTEGATFTISNEAGALRLNAISNDLKLNGQSTEPSTILSVGDQISIGLQTTTLIVVS